MYEEPVKINKWLYPLSFLYGIGVGLRNKLFDWGILRSKSFDVPVISIGNLAVGGTGKTPHTEYLTKLLSASRQVAVLSRGYKRRTKGFRLATPESSYQTIGDELFQIKKKFPDIIVAADGDRVRGINKLRKSTTPPVDVILLDDAYQHRAVKADVNILLTDYHRLFPCDALLPAGRLRESVEGKNRANIVIVTKCPDDIKPIDYNIISKRLALFPYQQLYFSSLRYGNISPLFPETGDTGRALSSIRKKEQVLLVTGIASPLTIINELNKYTKNVHPLSFSDHHDFSKKDVQTIIHAFGQLAGNDKIIVTTEKDATRLVAHPGLTDEVKKHIYVLPIEVKILQNQESHFNQYIINHVRKNKKNGDLPQR